MDWLVLIVIPALWAKSLIHKFLKHSSTLRFVG
jgi:hypothetical protein